MRQIIDFVQLENLLTQHDPFLKEVMHIRSDKAETINAIRFVFQDGTAIEYKYTGPIDVNDSEGTLTDLLPREVLHVGALRSGYDKITVFFKGKAATAENSWKGVRAIDFELNNRAICEVIYHPKQGEPSSYLCKKDNPFT